MRRTIANERIDLRTQPQVKYYLELAAFLGGFGSLTNFVLTAAEEQAKNIFSAVEHEKRILSAQDKALLLKMLTSPPEPNANLKHAINLLTKIYKEEGDQIVQEVEQKFIRDFPES